MPVISIVIPVWGAEAFLPRCLDSLLAQTFSDWEAVLVDDGSPDGSGAICDAYAARDNRFKAVHQPNQGGSIARNRGAALAAGQYLVFVDNDDLLAPCALELALAAQKQQPEDIVLWRWCDAPQGLLADMPAALPVQGYARQQAGQLFLESALYFAWNKLFDLRLVRAASLAHREDTDYGDDFIFSMDYAKAWFAHHPAGQFAMLEVPLYCYEPGNPASMTQRYLPTYCRDEERLCAYLMELFGPTGALALPQEDYGKILVHCTRTMGEAFAMERYGEGDTPLPERKARIRAMLGGEIMQALLGQLHARRLYSPYGFWLRHGLYGISCCIARQKEQHPRRYQRLYWAGWWVHRALTGRHDAPYF